MYLARSGSPGSRHASAYSPGSARMWIGIRRTLTGRPLPNGGRTVTQNRGGAGLRCPPIQALMRLTLRTVRRWSVPALVCVLSLLAIASVALLESHADASHEAQLKLANVKGVLNELQSAPFK